MRGGSEKTREMGVNGMRSGKVVFLDACMHVCDECAHIYGGERGFVPCFLACVGRR